MNILQVIASVNPHGGGPIETLKQVIPALSERGHSVEVASLDSEEQVWTKNFPTELYPLGSGAPGYGYSRKFKNWLRDNHKRFDAVIVRGLWQYSSFATWQVLRKSNVPYYVFAHGMLDPWFKKNYPLKHLKKWLYWPWAEYRVLRDAAAVLFTSEQERKLAQGSFWLYKCNERVVKYGTAAPPNIAKSKQLFSEEYVELSGKRFIIFVGRIHEKKGCRMLLQAFADSSKDKEIQLVFVGPDQQGMKDQLQADAQTLGIFSQVKFLGMLQGDLKWGALASAEALVLPSHQENFGVVVAEALACSTPVLISNKVNICSDILADQVGFVGEDNLAGTTEILDQWLALDEQQRAEYRQRAMSSYLNRYTIEQAADSLIGVLERD